MNLASLVMMSKGGIKNPILVLSLKCLLGIQVDGSGKQLDIRIWWSSWAGDEI